MEEETDKEETYEISAKIAKNSGTKINLKWSKVEGADGYEIYRATSKNGSYKKVKTIKNGETTSYTNSNLKYGKTYYYVVKAYENEESDKNYLCASTAISGKVVPTTTKITSAKVKNNKVTLKWKKVSGVSGYEVYRAVGKTGKYKKVKTLTSASKTTYVNNSLKDGKKYSYKIRAYKKVNGKKVYSEYSTIKSVTGK